MFEGQSPVGGPAAAPRSGLDPAQLAVLGARPLRPDDPARVGRYELLGVLGAGGMGRVYLGRGDGRLAAVKVIRSDFADDEEFRRRFARELESVSRIGAAFTAALVDSQTDGTLPWMATEYVPGIPLGDAVKAGEPLPLEAVWRLAGGIAVALVAIHQAGLIHRDLKPSNVILALDGPKVIDFGVAHSQNLSALTMTGQRIGTPSYMAPEQATTGAVLAASDVFAYGCLLAFAATGTPPFGVGATEEVIYRVVHQEPDLAALTALDPDLAALVGRCLAKDPAARPDAAAALAAIAGAKLPAEWPEVVRARIEPRAKLAGQTLVDGPGATLEQGAQAQQPSGYTSISAPGGLPRTPAAPEPVRRRRRGLVIGSAVAVVLIAVLVAALMLGLGGGSGAQAAQNHNRGSLANLNAGSGSSSGSGAPGSPGAGTQSGTPGGAGGPGATGGGPGATGPGGAGASSSAPGGPGGSPTPTTGGVPTNPAKTSPPAPPKTTTPPVSTSCSGWATADPNPGASGHATGDGSWNIYAGPYETCAKIGTFTASTALWFHCYVTNAYGNEWTYFRVSGTNTQGWISNANLVGDIGSAYRC